MADKGGALAVPDTSAFNIFEGLTQTIRPANTRSANTQMAAPFDPGAIGSAMSAQLNTAPKEVIHQLSERFPVNGMQPEEKAKMNLAAKLSGMAAADAKFYTTKANEIGGNMAEVYDQQVEHKANMFKHDLKLKKSDVKHLGSVEHWQTETVSLLSQARQRHAGIQLAASCL